MDDSANVVTGSGAPTDLAVLPTPPDPGPIGRLIGVFIRPRATFESMRERPRFLLPLIVLIAYQVIIAIVLFKSGVSQDIALAKLQEKNADPHQLEVMERFMESPAGLVFIVSGAAVFIGVVVLSTAAVDFFMGNLMLGAQLRFTHYLSAAAFAGVVFLVDYAVQDTLIILNRSANARTGLGLLFGDNTGPLINAFDRITDPFFLWGSAICALAISTFSRRPFKFGVFAALPGVILAVLMSTFR